MAFRAIKAGLGGAIAAAALAATTLPAAALDRWVTIVNNTGYTMVRFYASHRDAKTWEEDILGTDVLPSGRQVNINFDDRSGYCIFDFKAVFDDGDEVEVWNRNICELSTFTFNP
ncbi:MAG: hypothetical protein ACU0CY_08525 [Maritimibacter harenae]|jgi:hypothetical protein|uniref:Argininosuccinate lyase n=1 Tax=Maritimibacter harenae TaxID=2606218 RepID=A0A845MB31_9RHOB|nr:hypothetical protein [Maritimibacter harenae]MZR14704.1 hypothetical protein [Maritimibacter harenae]